MKHSQKFKIATKYSFGSESKKEKNHDEVGLHGKLNKVKGDDAGLYGKLKKIIKNSKVTANYVVAKVIRLLTVGRIIKIPTSVPITGKAFWVKKIMMKKNQKIMMTKQCLQKQGIKRVLYVEKIIIRLKIVSIILLIRKID